MIKEPLFVIASAFIVPAFKKYLMAQNIKSVFEKPLLSNDLQEILKEAKVDSGSTLQYSRQWVFTYRINISFTNNS